MIRVRWNKEAWSCIFCGLQWWSYKNGI